jgi:endoglycosylceramidase
VLDHQLQVAQQKVITAIRRVDPATPVYYEPNTLFADGIRSTVRPTGHNLGFSFHDYCVTAELGSSAGPVGQLVCDLTNNLTWSNAAANTRASGATPLLTEFGATTDQPTLTGVADLADQHLTGWMYWAYCGCDDPTTTGPGTEQALVFDPAQPPTGSNVDWAKMRALVTPYPELTAGTPTAYHFDRTSKVFTAQWSTARFGRLGRFGAGARTEISTPALVYPQGYAVAVTGGHVVSAPGARVLEIAQDAGALQVRVTVQPR